MLSVQPAGRTSNNNTGLPAVRLVLGLVRVITKTTLKAMIAGGGVMATWLAVAPNHPAPASVAAPVERSAAAHETAANELSELAKKLRERASAAAELRASTRNPFRFGTGKTTVPGASRVGGSSMSLPAAIASAAPVAPPAPSYTLSGIAERHTSEGRKRTAVISGAGQLYLVSEGETVDGRYLVVRVDPEAVLLRDPTGTELSLVLR